MARGDVRPVASNYRGGSYGRSSQSRVYDDEGRGQSERLWEWFERNFLRNETADEKYSWLMSQTDDVYYQLLKYSVLRYGLMDIAFFRTPGWYDGGDTRAHRLVIKHLDEKKWCEFHACMLAAYEREKERKEREMHAHAEEMQGRWAAYEMQRKAEAARIEREDWEAIHETVDYTAGMLSSELNQTFVNADAVGSSGEWIEDAVDVYTSGDGFGYDTQKATGVKLQVTLSLDLSNSMYYNGIHKVAATAFRDLGLTLRQLKAQYPEDLYVAFFTFSKDLYGERGRGMGVQTLREPRAEENPANPEIDFGQFRSYLPSVIENWSRVGEFDGTETYFTPLFEAIAKWESENSDPKAVRLDIVITDYVAEHKNDIRAADVVQERRNGNLQTVMLNFMSETEWLGSTLPKRCFMVKVDKDNIAGILRNILSEFVAVNM
jgi:hypothetical protein